MNTSAIKAIKAVGAIIVLAALLFTVRGYLRDYREAPRGPSTETTQTAEPASDSQDAEGDEAEGESAEEAGERLEVTIDGLNLRTKPDSTAEAVRGLKKGEIITVVDKSGDWYQVTTEKDEKGYITDNPGYTKAVK